jgi:hypothetical protein
MFGTYLYLQLCKALSTLKEEKPEMEIYFTNHPLPSMSGSFSANPVFYEGDRLSDLEEPRAFLAGIDRELEKNKNLTRDLKLLKQQYETLIHLGTLPLSYEYYYSLALWLSSLETVLFMLRNGIAYTIYEHGKDKKPLQIMHTTAILAYEACYGHWPSIQDTGSRRRQFENLLAHFYLTKHFHEIADLSAPGCYGIKNVGHYWLPGIIDAISSLSGGNTILELENQLAWNHDLEVCIGERRPTWEQGFRPYVIVAIQVPVQSRSSLLTHLKHILDDIAAAAADGHFKKRYNPSWWSNPAPMDMEDMKEILVSDANSAEKLAKIFLKMLTHPKQFLSSNNTSAIYLVYDSFMSLYKSPNNEKVLKSSLQALEKIRDDMANREGPSPRGCLSPSMRENV